MYCAQSKNTRLDKSKTAKLKNDILDTQYMCNFFYVFCSIGMYPFTPAYTRISLLMLEMRAGRQSHLFMSHATNSGMCRQLLVTILAVLELLHACEGRRNLTRSLGLITRLNMNQTLDLYSCMWQFFTKMTCAVTPRSRSVSSLTADFKIFI
jgi:hypothetical protein